MLSLFFCSWTVSKNWRDGVALNKCVQANMRLGHTENETNLLWWQNNVAKPYRVDLPWWMQHMNALCVITIDEIYHMHTVRQLQRTLLFRKRKSKSQVAYRRTFSFSFFRSRLCWDTTTTIATKRCANVELLNGFQLIISKFNGASVFHPSNTSCHRDDLRKIMWSCIKMSLYRHCTSTSVMLIPVQ